MPTKPADKSLEQGLCVLLMMAVQEGHRPVGSTALSAWLGVSDSYLKKILRKLTVAGLVQSRACPGGGFRLARSPEDVSVADVWRALQAHQGFEASGLVARIFPDTEHVAEAEERLAGVFDRAQGAYERELAQVRLTDLLRPDAWPVGAVDWRPRCLQKRCAVRDSP